MTAVSTLLTLLPLALAVQPEAAQAGSAVLLQAAGAPIPPNSALASPLAQTTQSSTRVQAERKSVPRPCDYSCCPCAQKTFSFKQERTSANATEGACIPCYDWVDSWVAPEYKDYCGTTSCSQSPYTSLPYDYTVVPRSYYTQYDKPVDYYHSDGSVVRHIPGYGNETLPPNWGTGLYGNGWNRRSYYYPFYGHDHYYERHHRKADEKAQSEDTHSTQATQEAAKKHAAKAFATEKAQIIATKGESVPTIFRSQRAQMESPCDLSCCPCANDVFDFSAPTQGSCSSCSDWMSSYIMPSHHDSCKCTAELAVKPYYTRVPHQYVKSAHDYMHDSVLANSTVYRHVPDMGDVRYPKHWSTPYNTDRSFYSNYINGHYYFPSYSSSFYAPHSDAKPWTPSTAQWFHADTY